MWQKGTRQVYHSLRGTNDFNINIVPIWDKGMLDEDKPEGGGFRPGHCCYTCRSVTLAARNRTAFLCVEHLSHYLFFLLNQCDSIKKLVFDTPRALIPWLCRRTDTPVRQVLPLVRRRSYGSQICLV
jgi:hypothetical protein